MIDLDEQWHAEQKVMLIQKKQFAAALSNG